MRMQVQFLASLSGLSIQHCRELWRRLQMELKAVVAVAVVYVGRRLRLQFEPKPGNLHVPWGWPLKKKKKKRQRHKNPKQTTKLAGRDGLGVGDCKGTLLDTEWMVHGDLL